VHKNVAVIGCGYWGKNLVRVFSQLGALRCVCDTDAARFRAISFPGDPPKFTDKLADAHPGWEQLTASGKAYGRLHPLYGNGTTFCVNWLRSAGE